VAAGTTATSDQISYSLSNSVDQMVTIYTTARNVEYYTNNNETLWSNFAAPDQSQSATVSGYSSGGNSVIGNITSFQTTQFTYRNTLGSAPVAAWENGALLKSKTSASAVESNAGSWYYDGAYLYLHASDGSNVSSNSKTYTYVTASSPSFTTFDNAKTWPALGKGRQTCVAPEADFALGFFAAFGKIVPSHQLCAFPYG